MASITRGAKWKVAPEDYVSHVTNLIQATSIADNWAALMHSGASKSINIYEQTSIDQIPLTDKVAIIVYERMADHGFLDVGGSERKRSVFISVDLSSGNRHDFIIVRQKLEKLFQDQNSVASSVKSGRSEYRYRLILNRQNNLSDVMSRMFRNVFEIEVKTRNEV